MYSLTDLEARRLKPVSLGQNQGVDGAMLLPEAVGENLVLVFPASVAAGIPWLVATSLQSLPLGSRGIFFFCLCQVSSASLLRDCI